MKILENASEMIVKLISPHSLKKHKVEDWKTIRKFPEQRGIYFIFNRKEELVYLGKSGNIKQRLRAHLSNTSSSIQVPKIDIVSASYVLMSKEIELKLAEALYLLKYKPKYNVSSPI